MRDAGWWDRAAEVYDHAAQAQVEDRGAVLDAECGEDAELRQEVESLLAQDVSRPGVLEEVAESARRGNPAFGPDEPAPRQIGRYRILGLIAEGGMGAVYEAEQDNPRRLVALKIVRPGLARAETLRRFERETQALGRLEHPNIARIYEAGVGDCGSGPQPYFAMERIHGETLTAYAERKALSTADRVRLMIAIVDAVQHAHERGIVHRDLKPANILVDAAGQPKVVDFGVAHVNDGGPATSRQTSIGEILGTLAYMSPEQILGKAESLDGRSDVYALGVLLYELLANSSRTRSVATSMTRRG
jgi:serine/threonine protein kinase